MKKVAKSMCGALTLALVVCSGVSVHAEEKAPAAAATAVSNPQAVVKYRESVMKAMGAYMAGLNAIRKGDVPYKNQAATLAMGLAQLSPLVPDLFPAGTGPDKLKTEALPAVWKEADKFKAASKAMDEETQKLVTAAKSGNLEALSAQFGAVGKTCGGCHDTFRLKD